MAGPQRKPQPDIYTLLLAIALVAMIICVIMLYMETAKYGQDPTSGVPMVVQVLPSSPLDCDSAVCWMPYSNSNTFVTNPTGCMDASSTSLLENRLSG
jgi:hypothetical protein